MDEITIRERIATLEAIVEEEGKATRRRLNNLEGLVESVHIIATETKALRENMNSLTVRVEEIEKKPERRLDSIVNIVLTAVVGGVIGYVLKMLF